MVLIDLWWAKVEIVRARSVLPHAEHLGSKDAEELLIRKLLFLWHMGQKNS
jgi:hypothetical protein